MLNLLGCLKDSIQNMVFWSKHLTSSLDFTTDETANNCKVGDTRVGVVRLFKQMCYNFPVTKYTCAEAKSSCISWNGALLTIDTKEEENSIRSIIKDKFDIKVR
jgi:hypothetical protein